MRKRQIDKLLKTAIIEEAEEQGALWEQEPVIAPIPEESQTRFDAALDGTKRTRTYEFADEPAPAPKRRVLIPILSAGLAVLVLGIGIVIGVNNAANSNTKPAASVEPIATNVSTFEPTSTEPTPWTGDGHWYNFLQSTDSGLISSLNVRYFALHGPYFVTPENAVAIGNVKGVPMAIKIYTNDPEERIIWSYSEHFWGMFIKEGVQLPEPDSENGDFAFSDALFRTSPVDIVAFDVFSEEACAETRALLQTEHAEESVSTEDLEYGPEIDLVFRDAEIPHLRYWLSLSVCRYHERLVMVEWKLSGESWNTEIIADIAPDSALYREYLAWEQATQEEASAERKTVYAATAAEFLAAIGSDTEIVLTGETYDLCTEAGQVGIVQVQKQKRLKITGTGTTVLKNASISAEGCTELVLAGIIFEKSTEDAVALKECSDTRIENCTIRDGVWPSYGVNIDDCSGIAISNCTIEGCDSAIYAWQGKALSVTDSEINDCGMALCLSGCEDVSVSGCAMHDCWSYEEPQSDDEEQGDATYWIQIDGKSSGVRFEDCELYGNKCTFLFGVYSSSDMRFSNLKLHDNDVDVLFGLDMIDGETGATVTLSDCEIHNNRVGTCFYAYADASTAEITLSGTTLRDNRIDRLFDLTHGGDYTVFGCALINNTVETCFLYDADAADASYGSVHDRDGNTLSEAELLAMQP